MKDAELSQRLDAIEKNLGALAEAQRRREETFDEMLPIMGLAMTEASDRLQRFEESGYFEFGRRLLGVADAVVEGFAPDDVDQLGQNVVSILETVKHMTQPRMLALANDAVNAVDDADAATPVGVFGMLKASNDDDVKRGLAVAIAILREIGKRARSATDSRTAAKGRLTARLAPRTPRTRAAPPPKRLATGPTRKKAPAPPKAAALEIPGIELDGEGFLADPSTWNQDMAMTIGRALGFDAFENGHWKVIEFARAEYERSGASPNVRKLASGSGLTTKDIYRLFRTAPGMAAARIAGISKPVGCI